MATIQGRISRGQKYWYIVESRRINGKPRPITLAYLGKADMLLKRLQGITDAVKLKSYSHGAIAALLKIAHELNVCEIINQNIESSREYTSEKPIRNNLTAGVTFLLAAIGRVCMPTSKRGWQSWAKTTSLEYLLKCNFNKVDSQHFWDLMDAMPVENIEKAEEALLKKAFELYQLESDSLFFDATNFFTYINTTNTRCTIAQRGKNKQKRYDLRQVGLAMIVTRKDMIPLFHLSYQGNIHDSKVFNGIITKIKERMVSLNLNSEGHTIIFDRGNNSKENMALIKESGLHYVGALVPYQHQQLIHKAIQYFETISADKKQEEMQVYRTKEVIWGEERTLLIHISEQLKVGQIRGMYQSLEKVKNALIALQKALGNPKGRKRNREKLEKEIKKIITGQFINNVIIWEIEESSGGRFKLSFSVDDDQLSEVENQLGFRILMTDRHDWDSKAIIKAYHGQSQVEQAFKNVKNPYHLTMKPQFHWTDQKIRVHFFICVLGYLLSTLVWREVKNKCQFAGTLNTLLTQLNNIRLATLLEESKKGKFKATYKLEEIETDKTQLMEALNIEDFHTKRPKLKGVGVYTG